MSVGVELMLARATLTRLAEPTDLDLWDLVRRHGPLDAVERIRGGAVGGAAGERFAHHLASVEPELDLDVAERYGIRLVTPESDDWPHFALAALEHTALERLAERAAGGRPSKGDAYGGEPVPPLALWVLGNARLDTLAVRSVAVVGSRAASPYGEHVASQLSRGLASRGFTVVSGGAYGIDAAAHRAALAAGGETVVVSAGGLEKAYPPSNSALFDRVRDSGLLVSESPPGSAPQRRRFLTRNRLIAAFGTGTVIVEAALRSGAMSTAGHARRLGRPLMAVPGPVTAATSVGCHDLIRREVDPATLVTSVDDVLAVIGSAGELPPERTSSLPEGDRRRQLDELDEDARRVFDGFPARRSVGLGELAAACGLSPVEVIRSIPALEFAGLICSDGAAFRIAPKVRSRPD